MIISGYDIGPLASAALYMAGGYTPSYSNSFKVNMMENKQLGKSGINDAELNATSTDAYSASQTAHSLRAECSPSSIEDKSRIGIKTGSNDRNMAYKNGISSSRLIKCFDFDILQITQSQSSSSSSSSRGEYKRIRGEGLVSGRTGVMKVSVPIECTPYVQANAPPPSSIIITPLGAATAATRAEAAYVEDDDYSDDETLYLDTPQGVFVYLSDHRGDQETEGEAGQNNQIDKSRKKATEAKMKGSDDDDDEDEDEDDEDIEDNWRDRGSEDEEEKGEEQEEEEESCKVTEYSQRGSEPTRNNGLGKTNKKGKMLYNKDFRISIPSLGSMLKLVTPSIDDIYIGRLVVKISRCAISASFAFSIVRVNAALLKFITTMILLTYHRIGCISYAAVRYMNIRIYMRYPIDS